MIEDKDRYLIDSVCKADLVLKALADSREPLSIAQIMEAVPELSKDRAFRLTATLESIGWISQVGEHYELGFGLGLFWAKKRAKLEAKKIGVERDIASLESPGEE